MKAHVIENGIVVNTLIVDSLNFMPNLVEATEGAIGWTYTNGVFTNPNEPTQQELDDLQAKNVRSKRDILLAETDWTVLQDSPLTSAQTADWVIYRQALRDITDHENFPYLEDADWPTKPV